MVEERKNSQVKQIKNSLLGKKKRLVQLREDILVYNREVEGGQGGQPGQNIKGGQPVRGEV